MTVSRKALTWGILLGILLVFYFVCDPMTTRFMPQCFFHRVTGLQCMGCGSQRVIHHLLHGEFKEALNANALMVIAMPALLFLICVELRRTKWPRLYARIHSQATIIGAAAILLVWGILRNLPGVNL